MDKKVPILLITFNRLEETLEVLKVVKQYKPKNLFVASDGPRSDKPGEYEKIKDIREEIVNSIDWDCELETRFSSKNFGCKIGVFNAVNWFFEQVDFGVILEDDIIPNIEFFDFCLEMSKKYENEEKVLSVCGYNPLPFLYSKKTYYFSKYFFSWGWATWKDKWKRIDIDFYLFKNLNYDEINDIYPFLLEKKIRLKKIKDSINGKNNSWASPWNFTHHFYNAYSIIPYKNQIKNIGFSNEFSTHTKESFFDKFFMDLPVKKLDPPPFLHQKCISEKKKITYYFLFKELIRNFFKKIYSK